MEDQEIKSTDCATIDEETWKSQVLSPIPIIIASAALGIENIEGAAAFIPKPLDIDLLLMLVAEYSTD